MEANLPTGETMSEGSTIPPKPPTMPAKASGEEICVPLASLAMPGEDEKLENPAEGDPVQCQIEGKVSRVEGDNAYVKIESVNGKPVDAESAKTKSTPEQADYNGDNEFAQLQSEAAGMRTP